MKVIHVIPIAKGIGIETLSYFTSTDVKAGSVVEVPLRSKTIAALVVSVDNAADIKSEIKNADFAFRKVDSLSAKEYFLPEFLDAAKKTADYFATTSGSVLKALIPAEIIRNIKDSPELIKSSSPRIHEKQVIQGDDEDRFTHYRSLIREEFARKNSVFFCVPTIEDAKRARAQLEKGIDEYTFLLHSSLSKKALLDTWKKIIETKHAILIIGTGQFLSVPRADIHTIILEKENSRSYKMPARPYLDVRTFAEFYAHKIQARLVMGDILLRTETLWRESQGELVQSAPFKFRSLTTAEEVLKDMRSYKSSGGGFKILSDEVEELIQHTKDESEQMFILTVRRGIAPSTVCGDCQNIVTCHNCSAPVVLHKSKNDDDKNFFLCHRCGERRSTEELCKVCGSWKLGTVGIGIDMIADKIKDRFPDVKVFRIDADTTKTEKAVEETITKFYESPGSILLGTEMALTFLNEEIENAAIISIDSLFSVPDFRIHEKIFYMLLKMRYITSSRFILQTRNPEEKVLEYAQKGNLIDFYREQIEGRKKFDYPPFTTLIKITLEGEREVIIKDMDAIQTTLEPFTVDVFPAFTQTVRGKFVLHGLIRIPRPGWMDTDLLEKLRSLPPYVAVKVDPDSLL